MTFTPTMWSILETAREKPHILLRLALRLGRLDCLSGGDFSSCTNPPTGGCWRR